MQEAIFYDTLRQGLWVAFLISLPILSVALLTGLVVGLFQALTSVQEMTLTFVPKLAAINDKFTVVRSICHKDPNHGGGNHYMMTGAPTPVPVNCGAFVSFHPSFGWLASTELL